MSHHYWHIGLDWLRLPGGKLEVAGKSGISQARTRLGSEPLKILYQEVVKPIATPNSVGARYRGWLLTSIDGSTLDVADTEANRSAFGKPDGGRGRTGFPKLRFVSLVESGTHVLFGAEMSPYSTGEATIAKSVVNHLGEGMICLADRYFYSYGLWKQAKSVGAELLWRVRKNARLPCIERFPDGSFLSKVYPSTEHRRKDLEGIEVRVIEYQLVGIDKAEPLYRLISTITDPSMAPAKELAALYQERWEIETAIGELKTHLKGSKIVLRSKTPDLVMQEFYGLLLAHFAIRALIHEAALKAKLDPDALSFLHAVRVVRRKLPGFVSIPPSGGRKKRKVPPKNSR